MSREPQTEAGLDLLAAVSRYTDAEHRRQYAEWIATVEAEAHAAGRQAAALSVERLAEALFLYRTSTNIPLPPDYWQRQSASMKQPFLDEARAILAALEAEQ